MQSVRKAVTVGALLGALAAALLGAAVLARSILLQRATVYTDGDRIRVPAKYAPIRRILWQPAEPVPAAAGVVVDEYEPRVSADGMTMVLVRGRAGANADLYLRTRTDAGWSAESPIVELNTEAEELGPELSSDGRALYFYSDRGGGVGGFDLWVSRRSESSWGVPMNLGPVVNTEFNEYGPALTPDGRELYFASNRPRPDEPLQPRNAWTATIREQRGRHDYDLYLITLPDDGIPQHAPTSLLNLNTPSDEGAPAVSPVGDFVYFASDRPGGSGGFDVYRSRRSHGTLMPAENIGTAINSPSDDLDPGLGTDGFRLYFSSNRPLPAPTACDPVLATPYSLWASGSREVFAEVDHGQSLRAIADLWESLWPWIVVLLLVALLAALLWWLSRFAAWKDRYRRLSLIARCVVVSLIIHALIASALAVWRVGTGIGELLRRSGGTRVVLASASTASSLTAQIRGLPPTAPARPDAPTFAERPAIARTSIDAPRVEALSPPNMEVHDSELSGTVSDARRPQELDVPSEPAAVALVISPAHPSPNDVALPREPVPTTTVAETIPAVETKPEVPRTNRAAYSSPLVATVPRVEITSAPTTDSSADRATARPDALVDPSHSFSPQPPPLSTSAHAPAPLAPNVALTAPVGLPRESPVVADVESERLVVPKPDFVMPPTTKSPLSMPTVAALAPPSQVTLVPPRAGELAADHSARADRTPLDRPRELLEMAAQTLPAARPITPVNIADVSAIDRASPRLPAVPAEAAPVETFAQRDPEVREQVLRQMGGNEETERAVRLALDWFGAHQSADGRWSGRDFDDRCGACAGPAEIHADAAMTGMVLLCYLGAGHTHTAEGPYQPRVKRAIDWLVARQAPDGDLRAGETMYSHTIATVALCEAFAMTRDGTLEAPTKRAARFLFHGAARAGGGRNGTSVLGWEVMAVESARRAGIETPRTTFESARRFLDSMAAPGEPGKYAYRRGDAPNAAMTAEAMFVRQLLGHSREEPRMAQSAAFILDTPPRWKDGAPTYYWYYATLALFQQQGDTWEQWNSSLTPELLKNQRDDGPTIGSWDPQDEWSKLGGRVYQTAVCTLSLEVYYRYRAQGLETPTPSTSPAR